MAHNFSEVMSDNVAKQSERVRVSSPTMVSPPAKKRHVGGGGDSVGEDVAGVAAGAGGLVDVGFAACADAILEGVEEFDDDESIIGYASSPSVAGGREGRDGEYFEICSNWLKMLEFLTMLIKVCFILFEKVELLGR